MLKYSTLKRHHFFISLLTTMIILLCSYSETGFATRLEKHQRQALSQTVHAAEHLGLIIQSMKNNAILYEQAASHHFVPASNLKLFTATAALLYLGNDYRYHTSLLRQAKINSNTLKGNLYLQFSGDPSLTQKDVNLLFQALKKKGIHHIKGDLIIDNTRFDQVPYGHGWMWDELDECYTAPINAVIIDNNCLYVQIAPSNKIGNKGKILKQSTKDIIKFNNKIKTAKKNSECELSVKHLTDNRYELKGCIPANIRKQTLEFSNREPMQFSRALIKQLLKKERISLSGTIRFSKVPSEASMITEHTSAPLSELSKNLLKDSENIYAEAFIKTLGEIHSGEGGSWENGIDALKQVLGKPTDIDFDETVIVDGSGLSRYNLLQPKDIAKLLAFIYQNPKVGLTVIHALPIAGLDGTLENRLLKKGLRGQVRAKTGGMTGVSSLAGFLTTSEHEVISFVMMSNDFVAPLDEYREVEDRLLGILAKKTREG